MSSSAWRPHGATFPATGSTSSWPSIGAAMSPDGSSPAPARTLSSPATSPNSGRNSAVPPRKPCRRATLGQRNDTNQGCPGPNWSPPDYPEVQGAEHTRPEEPGDIDDGDGLAATVRPRRLPRDPDPPPFSRGAPGRAPWQRPRPRPLPTRRGPLLRLPRRDQPP